MKKEQWATLTVRTNRGFNIVVITKHIDPRYELVCNDTSIATDTGELRLFRIQPQPPTLALPSFSGRWDHASNTVDVDLIRNGRIQKNAAFQGHHTVRDGQGVFHVDIHLPLEGNVFTGTIELGTELGLRLADSML